jgi:hypothetical protein
MNSKIYIAYWVDQWGFEHLLCNDNGIPYMCNKDGYAHMTGLALEDSAHWGHTIHVVEFAPTGKGTMIVPLAQAKDS